MCVAFERRTECGVCGRNDMRVGMGMCAASGMRACPNTHVVSATRAASGISVALSTHVVLLYACRICHVCHVCCACHIYSSESGLRGLQGVSACYPGEQLQLACLEKRSLHSRLSWESSHDSVLKNGRKSGGIQIPSLGDHFN